MGGGEIFKRIGTGGRIGEGENEGSVLHRQFKSNGRVIWQKLVPGVLRDKCLQIFHEGMAHTGSTRMLSTLRLHYYWDGMRTEAVGHCQNCRSCKLRQIYYCQPKVPVQEYPEVQAAMERVHLDITGRLTKTEEGNEYILVVKDFQTKYVWIFPIADKRAETIADLLVKYVFRPFGPPKILISDRGTEFRNKLVNAICKTYRVKRICTTRFNPRSNGFVENHNNTMKNQLYHYANVKHTDWDQYLHTIEQAYNTTVSVATGYTPFYAMFGREMQTADTGVWRST
jgi:transposase InsO family protein